MISRLTVYKKQVFEGVARTTYSLLSKTETETKSRSIKKAKERPTSSHLDTEQAWPIKDFLNDQKENLLAGPMREIPSGQDRPTLPARVANENTGFASSWPLVPGYEDK